MPLILLALCLGPGLAAQTAGNTRTISLNGDWNFLADPTGKLTLPDLASVQNVRPTRIPSSWQSQFTDLRDYAGVAWYWRTVSIDAPGPDQVVLLRFGAVDYRAEVFVNGQKAGSTKAAICRLSSTSPRSAVRGKPDRRARNRPGREAQRGRRIRYAEIPHGKQNWYVQTSGLWQERGNRCGPACTWAPSTSWRVRMGIQGRPPGGEPPT